jgi:hypothetical protein
MDGAGLFVGDATDDEDDDATLRARVVRKAPAYIKGFCQELE